MATRDDDIKAGEYELTAELWDEITSKPGQPFTFKRHRKGELVDLNAEDARRLVLAGAVVEPGSIERAQVEALRQQYLAALAALPPEVVDAGTADASGPVVGGSEGAPAGSGSAPAPVVVEGEDEGDDSALPPHIQGMTVDDLKTYAATNDIDVKGLKAKGEIQAAIVKAEAAE